MKTATEEREIKNIIEHLEIHKKIILMRHERHPHWGCSDSDLLEELKRELST